MMRFFYAMTKMSFSPSFLSCSQKQLRKQKNEHTHTHAHIRHKKLHTTTLIYTHSIKKLIFVYYRFFIFFMSFFKEQWTMLYCLNPNSNYRLNKWKIKSKIENSFLRIFSFAYFMYIYTITNQTKRQRRRQRRRRKWRQRQRCYLSESRLYYACGISFI